MKHFEVLQNEHSKLLEKQFLAETAGASITNEALIYIERIRQEAQNINSPEERETLRSYLRYWASYVYNEQIKDPNSRGISYPDTTMPPAVHKSGINLKEITSPLISIGIIFLVVILVLVIIIAIVLFIKFLVNAIILISSSNPNSKLTSESYLALLTLFPYLLVIITLVFGRRWINARIVRSGGVAQMVDKVRKTIVAGGRRAPLAVLVVIDGPQQLINKELKVFAESATLGRDPRQADFIFYQDSNSSVSGLHAKLERLNGQWRLVGISKSGNETFLDDQAIPNFEPQTIRNGQRIRMGYYGQQPVELEFREVDNFAGHGRQDGRRLTKAGEQNVPRSTSDFDFNSLKTTVRSETSEAGPDENVDSLFDSFRERK